jgi:glycosyltransferase involved in cell wall biosynthesis
LLAGRNELDYTIIVPIFNRPEHLVALHERLASLNAAWQSCGRGEIVVVDDGSTDATPAVARRIAESSTIPMRVVTQPNKGVSGARNRGFWEARGAIGVVIDSDCLPDPQWLPAMLAAVSSEPRTLAFANIYSERRPKYPLEASPSGAPFVGASFATRVDDYAAIGGNCELFAGASRDDGDFYLTAKEAGFTVRVVDEARVWHPIRVQTNGAIFRGGLQHSYDNLLAKRHGDRALFYLGDWLLGGSFAGHYPFTLAAYAFIILAAYDVVVALLAHAAPNAFSLVQVLFALIAVWIVAQGVFMQVLGVGWKRWLRFMMASFAHVAGAGAGRLRGTFEHGFVLL